VINQCVFGTNAQAWTCLIGVSIVYSSLSYLLSFPLDRIKIDRSFTMGLGLQERASVLVEGVSSMSRMIEALGTISEAQGYLFSRPVPEKDVAGLLRRDFRVQAA
jgi:EAL domain-containing protein (putative c-di-GMP-specific phosphodiesterase class I)